MIHRDYAAQYCCIVWNNVKLFDVLHTSYNFITIYTRINEIIVIVNSWYIVLESRISIMDRHESKNQPDAIPYNKIVAAYGNRECPKLVEQAAGRLLFINVYLLYSIALLDIIYHIELYV